MDESLREEIRNVSTPADRLRVAAKLERVGLRDEAQDVLEPAVDDEEVRKELARFPGWTHTESDGGRTRWIDAAPIERAPRVLWRARGAVPWELGGVLERHQVLASPLSVVISSSQGVATYQARSGEHRLLSTSQAECILQRDRLLLMTEGEARSLWTGQLVSRMKKLEGSSVLSSDEGSAVGMQGDRIHLCHVGDLGPIPQASLGKEYGAVEFVIAGSLAVVRKMGSLSATDLETCESKWSVRHSFSGGCVLVGDAGGVVVGEWHDHSETSIHDPAGRLVGRHPSVARALSPRLIVGHALGRLVALSREGREEWSYDMPRVGVLAMARDTVYAWGTNSHPESRTGAALVAIRDGQELWRFEDPALPGIASLAVTSRRLYVVTTWGDLFALGE